MACGKRAQLQRSLEMVSPRFVPWPAFREGLNSVNDGFDVI